MMQRALVEQQDAHQQQLQIVHDKLASIERMQQSSPLVGLDGSIMLGGRPADDGMSFGMSSDLMSSDNGSERLSSQPPLNPLADLPPLKPNLVPNFHTPHLAAPEQYGSPTLARGDDAFEADAFEQCYPLHMVAYGAAAMMTVSLKYSSRACDGGVQFMMTALLLAFLCCFVGRWLQHKMHQDRLVEPSHTPVSRVFVKPPDVEAARTFRYSFLVCLCLMAFSLYSGLAWETSDFCRADGTSSDMWATMLPSWYAHVGTLEMLAGLVLTTHQLGKEKMLIIGIASHICFAVANIRLILPAADEENGRTTDFILLCHGVQQLSFLLGCFLGHSLMNGQRRFFNKAWTLHEAELLQKRCDQLQAEKERAVYERQILQHNVNQHMNELKAARDDSSYSSRTSGRATETLYPAPNESSAPRTASATDMSSMSSFDSAITSVLESPRPSTMPKENEASSDASKPMGLESGVALPKESSSMHVPTGSRKSVSSHPSSAGWTELNMLISANLADGAEPTGSQAEDQEGANSPAVLNPNAREWAPPMCADGAKGGA